MSFCSKDTKVVVMTGVVRDDLWVTSKKRQIYSIFQCLLNWFSVSGISSVTYHCCAEMD